MTSELSTRGFRADEWRVYRALRLAALEDAPTAFGSLYEQEVQRSEEHWRVRLREGVEQDRSFPVGAWVGARAVGLAWGWVDPEDPARAHLFQMWVAPDARRAGAGRLLLESIIDWARGSKLQSLELSVTCGNAAAQRLYERAGFEPAGETEPLREGSSIRSQPMRMIL